MTRKVINKHLLDCIEVYTIHKKIKEFESLDDF